MTHEELKKECTEILGARFVKRGLVGNKKEFDDNCEEIKEDEDFLAMIDAMMEVAAKAWEQGYEISENKHDHFNKVSNPYLKPE